MNLEEIQQTLGQILTVQRQSQESQSRLEATVASLTDSVTAHDRQNEERDRQMDLMAIGINRLLESSIEYSRWRVETDRRIGDINQRIEESNQRIEESNQRFNILLEEIRAVNRRVTVLENQ